MSKKLSKALRTDLNEMAALLRSKGRGRDTILAHINPEEAALLKRRGGSGTINPETGIMEFEDGSFDWFSPSTWFGGGGEAPVETQTPETTPAQEFVAGGGAAPEVQGGVDMTQYFADPNYQEALTGNAPQDEAAWFQDYMKQFSQPLAQAPAAPAAGGFGTAEPFDVSKAPKFDSGAQFGAAGVEIPKDTYAAQQIEAGIEPSEQQKKDLEDKGIDWKKLSAGTLMSLLGTAGKFGLGYALTKPIQRTQQKAATESAAMGEKIGALGAPTKAVGTQMLAAAESGQLTPVQRRNVQALRAQQRQALSRAGITSGTAALQAEANVQRLANEYVNNNISSALNMMQFGDKYVAQGIRAGYDANQQANQASNIFYQNLFRMLGGTSNPFGG